MPTPTKTLIVGVARHTGYICSEMAKRTAADAIRAMRERHTRAAAVKMELARPRGDLDRRSTDGIDAKECFAALDALMEAGMWPAPRDPVSELGVAEVRARWAKIGHRAREEDRARASREG